ncbi:hypothetical protein CBR_g40417 [Chara braunii]|uniref:Peptide methionine sulfoxide reductase A5 n=1 Tax=Chara braunii TaxID=69332 RepID=A0A388LTU9_CHABU|nr:hypothetical protein CBR_g40417 [Chara braunii]|eukprot:GBG85685.1 hypothetical protein CBR_g40417 [Chara braunii]
MAVYLPKSRSQYGELCSVPGATDGVGRARRFRRRGLTASACAWLLAAPRWQCILATAFHFFVDSPLSSPSWTLDCHPTVALPCYLITGSVILESGSALSLINKGCFQPWRHCSDHLYLESRNRIRHLVMGFIRRRPMRLVAASKLSWMPFRSLVLAASLRPWLLVLLIVHLGGSTMALRSMTKQVNVFGGEWGPTSKGFKTATFALGSFWTAEAVFGCFPGVIRTRVGYAGGNKVNPDYNHIVDHAEAVEIDYDPSVISYEELLDIFWKNHNPTQSFGQGPDVGRQYRSIILTRDAEEEQLAKETKKSEQTKYVARDIKTEIRRFDVFYPAEPVHQKFELKQRPQLMQLVSDLSEAELMQSTKAAQLNAYAAGLCPHRIMKEIDSKVLPLLALLRGIGASVV